MGRGRWGGGQRDGETTGRQQEGAREVQILEMYIMEWLVDIGYRVELQADRMPGPTEAMAFTDSYKHRKCLGGMRLQFFLTNFHFVYP